MAKFKKELGQNFLYDPAISKKIIDFSGIERGSNVLEIGPGRGILTEELLNRNCRVFCIERDESLCDYLNGKFGEGIKIFNEDILSFDVSNLKLKDIYVIGNLPYNISTAILKKFTLSNINLKSMTFMFQYEVAMRISADVGNNDYGSLTVFSKSFWKIEKGFKLSPGSFFPPPKVFSYVLKFLPLYGEIDFSKREKFFLFLNSIFMYRRKKLSTIFKKNNFPEELLYQLGVSPELRPQNLSVGIYQEIFKNLLKSGTF